MREHDFRNHPFYEYSKLDPDLQGPPIMLVDLDDQSLTHRERSHLLLSARQHNRTGRSYAGMVCEFSIRIVRWQLQANAGLLTADQETFLGILYDKIKSDHNFATRMWPPFLNKFHLAVPTSLAWDWYSHAYPIREPIDCYYYETWFQATGGNPFLAYEWPYYWPPSKPITSLPDYAPDPGWQY